MRRKRIDREVVVLLITTLITIGSWVGFEVYRAYVKVTVPAQMEKYLEKIDPTLNQKVFTDLDNLM